MTTRIGKTARLARAAAAAGALTMVGAAGAGAEEGAGDALPFPVASVHFEQNATDGDVEVVYRAKAADDGLAALSIVGPDGRTVSRFAAPDASTLGLSQFRLESPEPPDTAALKAAYPEGVYKFVGETFKGARLVGASTLSHALPATAGFMTPAPEAENVPVTGLVISWRAAEGAAFYIVELEQDEMGTRIEATLPASLTSLAVPDGFLAPDTEYQLGIGTVSGEGNISFVETSFLTAP